MNSPSYCCCEVILDDYIVIPVPGTFHNILALYNEVYYFTLNNSYYFIIKKGNWCFILIVCFFVVFFVVIALKTRFEMMKNCQNLMLLYATTNKDQ